MGQWNHKQYCFVSQIKIKQWIASSQLICQSTETTQCSTDPAEGLLVLLVHSLLSPVHQILYSLQYVQEKCYVFQNSCILLIITCFYYVLLSRVILIAMVCLYNSDELILSCVHSVCSRVYDSNCNSKHVSLQSLWSDQLTMLKSTFQIVHSSARTLKIKQVTLVNAPPQFVVVQHALTSLRTELIVLSYLHVARRGVLF